MFRLRLYQRYLMRETLGAIFLVLVAFLLSEAIFKGQQQIQGNMQALGQTGKEGALRVQYVEQLEQSEASLKGLGQKEAQAKAEIEKLRQEIDAQLKKMG